MKKKKAAIYARVSTMQQEQEATIASQIAELEAYAAKEGYEVAAANYYIDEAVSGARLERRGLDQLRDQAAGGAFEIVLCLSPDRLARQYVHQWLVLDELQRVGIKLIFITQPEAVKGAHGQLLTGIQGLFAEYERAVITERMRRGKLYRVRQGELLSPNPPYGYRYIPVGEVGGGQWRICESEAVVVRQLYEWYLNEQMSIRQLRNRLNERKIATPSQKSTRWSDSSVRAILKQQAYTGRSYYNRTRRQNETIGRPRRSGRGHRQTAVLAERPLAEWIEIKTPAILAETVWQEAQERIEMNRKYAGRNNQRQTYLLRGLLVCHVCGHTLSGRTNSNGSFYYCPYGGKKRSPDVAQHSCTIPGYLAEPLVWQEVTRLLRNPTLVADAWHNQQPASDLSLSELTRLEQRQRHLEKQWLRLLDLYQDSLIDKAELEQRKAVLDNERQQLEQQLQQQRQLKHTVDTRSEILDNFTAFAQKIEASLATPSFALQQEVIRLLIDHIVIEQDAIVIKHIIPTDDDCRLTLGRRYGGTLMIFFSYQRFALSASLKFFLRFLLSAFASLRVTFPSPSCIFLASVFIL